MSVGGGFHSPPDVAWENDIVATPRDGGGWWYVFPDGKAHGPFMRGQIATRWRRYRIIRNTPPEGMYVPRLLAWQHAALDPFAPEGERRRR